MQKAAHCPQKGFRLLEDLEFFPGENAVMHEIARIFDTIKIFSDPIERLQVAQAALAVLDVGFDQIAALALAYMTLVAFGELGFDEILAVARGDVGPEFPFQFLVQPGIAAQITRLEQRGADGDVLFA